MKKILAFFLSVILIAQTASAVCAVDAADTNSDVTVEIHVSPSGSDGADGSVGRPLATINKAKQMARTIRAEKEVPIDIIFHEGIYRLSQTVNFDSGDSGTADAPITYKAAEGEKVVFKGSKELDMKAFKEVTDPAILKRIPESARDYVGVLDLRAQGINQIAAVPVGRSGVNAIYGYHELFFNGEAQTLARFPNSEYTTIKKITNSVTKTFQMAESNITRWGAAKDVRIGGYFQNDYNFERPRVEVINAEERTIKLPSGTTISGANRRFYVYNLLEELDMPGEWYIDPESFLLYYYPPTMVSNETLEISVLGEAMFKLKDVHFVNFENLEFAQMRFRGFELPSCTDIGFYGCVFSDIKNSAIRDFSDVYGEYRSTPNTYRFTIKDCIFKNIGWTTIVIKGGDETTLEESGHLIENCYFSGIGTEIISYVPSVSSEGVGNVIRNCTFHNAGSHLITPDGSLHKIYNNELFDACKEVHDSGAIYDGRNLYTRGVEIANNYIHHVKSLDKTIGEIACGVYMDDRLSEWYIHHNIFEGMSRGVFMNTGNDAEIHDNIFINNDVGVRISGAKGQWQNLKEAAKAWTEQYPVYLERFPKINNIYEPVMQAHDNAVKDNLFVNSPKEIPVYEGDDPELANEDINNFMTDEFADFNNPEKSDYTIKEGSSILETHPELGNISIDNVGVSDEMLDRVLDVLDTDIIRTLPRNGAENVNAAKVEFKWTKSYIYDKYRIKIATDAEMKDVVIDEIVSYNYFVTNQLNADVETYYWTVEGVDISSDNLENKPALGKPYKFITSKYENTDKILLEEEIKKAEEFIATLSEGEQDGQCKPGTLETFQNSIDLAKAVYESKYASQTEVDNIMEDLLAASARINSQRNVGYLSVSEFLADQEHWGFSGGVSSFDSTGALKIDGSEYGYYAGKELAGYQMLKLKMYADFVDGDWIGFGLRQQAPGMAYAVGGVGYMLIIKQKKIEFQRYNSGGGMLKEIDNNCIKPNTWHEIEVGAIDVEGGIRVILRVDGETILNELDTEGVITKQGYFQVYNRLSTGYSGNVTIAPSDEEIGVFDKGIITGKLSPVTPTLVDGYDALLLNAENLKTFNASYENTNGVIKVKANNSENCGTLSSVAPLNGNEVFKASVKFDLSDGWQGIGLRADGYEDNAWNLENYIFVVKKDFVELQRFTENGSTYLGILPNNFIKSGEFTDLTFGAYPTDNGMRIIIYADGNKVFDYTDVYSKHKSLNVNFYDRNGKGMEIKKSGN